MRFETPPGHQLQIDFGTVRVPVGGERTKVHLFVATLGFSRRTYNARALVNEHDVQTREISFNDRFHAFCRCWGVTPRACTPYRARTKGKDDRSVG